MRYVLIFVVGLGECMCLFIDCMFKLLLVVGGKLLIVWYLEKFVVIGVNYVVINILYLVEQFFEVLGDGLCWGLCICYVYEGFILLEIGGGMFNVLLLLGFEFFLVINGDIWIDFDFVSLFVELYGVVQLVMVDNFVYYFVGDFILDESGCLYDVGELKFIFVGVGVYWVSVLEGWQIFVFMNEFGCLLCFVLVLLLCVVM